MANKKVMGKSVPNEDWLNLVHEEALEPALPIIDAHHHLWIRSGHRYLVPEFVEDMRSGHNIVATVYAECHSMYRQGGDEALQSLGETEFVAGCAAMADSGVFGTPAFCKGMVGNVDLRLGDKSRAVFEQHIERSGGRFKGVRFTTAWDQHDAITNQVPSSGLLIEAEVVAAAKVMAELDLTLDIWVYHPQLTDVARLAAMVPDLTIVLNHTGVPILGGPYGHQHEQVFDDWQSGMKTVAQCGNVYLKLGALPIRKRGDGKDRSVPPGSQEICAAWSPWMHACIDAFGVQRCIFESNFPVQKLFSSYVVTWNAFKRLARGCTEAEKAWLFHDAAVDAYRL